MITGPVPVPVAAAGQPGAGGTPEGGEDFMAMLASLAGPSAETGQDQPEESGTGDQQPETQTEALPAPVPASLQSALQAGTAPQQGPQSTPVPETAVDEAPAQPAAETVPTASPAQTPADLQPADEMPAPAAAPVTAASGTPVVPALPVPAVQELQAAGARITPVQPQTQAVAAVRQQAEAPAAVLTHAQAAGIPLERPAAFRIPEAAAAPTAPAAPAAEPSVQAMPVQAQAPASQPVPQTPAVQAPAPVPAQAPLHTQLAKPVFTLAAAGNGEHVMTMKVTPEELGTVTVRAVIGPEGVRMELFASDSGRDAVKAIMPDLRRELAAAGFNASLDLGSGTRPDSQGAPGDGRQRAGAEPRQPEPGTAEDPYPAIRRMFTDGAASLDVMA